MSDYTRIQGDTGPSLQDTLQTDGEPDDLTDATVQFTLWDPDSGTVVQDEEATIADAQNGQVEWNPNAGDFDSAGLLYFEWGVEFSDGTQISYRRGDGSPKQIEILTSSP